MKHITLTTLASFGILLGLATSTPAQMHPKEGMGEPLVEQTSQFQRIEQPFWMKAAVTAGGFGLIGLELWWFLFSKPIAHKAKADNGT